MSTVAEATRPESEGRVSRLHERLTAWDLSVQKRYMVQKGIYTAEEIEEVEAEYKKYLALAISEPEMGLAISAKIDDFWHTHILFTQDYAHMCHEVAGHFLHHRPSILDDREDLVQTYCENTLATYEKHFGAPSLKYWDDVVCKCANNCKCTKA